MTTPPPPMGPEKMRADGLSAWFGAKQALKRITLPLVERIYFMPCTPLIACSSGMVTADSTVWAFAPM